MSTFAVSEQRQVDGTSYVRVARDREPSRRALSSAAEFIGDVVNQIAPERRLAAPVLRQATVDLRRFRDSKEAAGCEMYWEARRWFISNDTKWPYSFTNVCRSLGLSPEGVRNEVFADARFVWVAHSGTCRLRHSNAAGGLALTSLFCLAAAVLSHSQSYENATSLEDLEEAWRRLMWRRALAHDPFFSLNITSFNFSSGRDWLLQKERQFWDQRGRNRRR